MASTLVDKANAATVREAAEILGAHPATIRAAARDGRLPFTTRPRGNGEIMIVDLTEVEDLVLRRVFRQQEIHDMVVREGYPIKEVAKRFGVTKNTIYTAVRREKAKQKRARKGASLGVATTKGHSTCGSGSLHRG